MAKMDFDIILRNGIKNRDNKNQLTEYFIREFKKAERDEFLTMESFYNPLEERVHKYEIQIEENFILAKEWYSDRIEKASRNELDFWPSYIKNGVDENEGIDFKTYSLRENQKELNKISEQISTLSIDKVFNDKNKTYNYSEIQLLKKSISEAKEGVNGKSMINNSRTKALIVETFTKMDKHGWKYAFTSEQDYNLYTNILTNFFEYKPYSIPNTTIKLKKNCKTKVAKALGEIHKEASNENKLSNDNEYFKLIRVLNHFEKETEGNLYKALTR